MGVKWDSLYRQLDALTVTIPERADGEPPDPNTLIRLFGEVQNNRVKAERLQRYCERKIALLRRSIAMNTERRRLERARAENNLAVRAAQGRRKQEAAIELVVEKYTMALANEKGSLAEWEAALRAVTLASQTLETAKQTLNSMRNLMMFETRE